ncbi:hypothetical protein WICMUC_004134 [Wickerhamomyces mucosus]|uniref:Pyridoxamine 5'-phosphate oxidase N-terminal domain-containing protein n=1 Tax=Wickerhamomyces mucosus TaxID=1378264 RepID=A0A9P8PI94_9ASCO|nr:hypothetical protein WICMUC_004134 [Wickerhamomyces mucosus]
MATRTFKNAQLPSEVVSLLKSGKLVHLATATKSGIPEVNLMNYHYLAESEIYSKLPKDLDTPESSNTQDQFFIILPTNIDTDKYHHVLENPNVSLLFHDWTTARNIQKSRNDQGEQSNLLRLLQDLNQTELSQVSATLSGDAKIVSDKEELSYYKSLLLEENPDSKVYVEGDENSIILVKIKGAKICDSHNNQVTYT